MRVRELYEQKIAAGELMADPAQSRAIDALDAMLERLKAQPAQPKRSFWRRKPEAVTPPRGLYMWGGVGRGKSMMMDLAVDVIDLPVRRIHFHEFMQWVHDRLDEARKAGAEDAIQPVAERLADELRVLAFDEMQITDVADAMIVGRLFEGLFARGVAVLTTSNRHPDDLYKNGLNRQIFLPFIDKIKDNLEIHEIASETDYRQEFEAGGKVYFAPLGGDTSKAMDQIWVRLAGGNAQPHSLTIKGRRVELPAYFERKARARFFDLCGQMLGPKDYLEIAAAVDVLVLDDIPQLGRSNFNEAKRFVTLVDALYEAKVRLICSAAAEPEQLYLEGEGAFEFERTASRLREMAGAEWGL